MSRHLVLSATLERVLAFYQPIIASSILTSDNSNRTLYWTIGLFGPAAIVCLARDPIFLGRYGDVLKIRHGTPVILVPGLIDRVADEYRQNSCIEAVLERALVQDVMARTVRYVLGATVLDRVT